MIEFITGASGTGKTTAMFDRIKDFQKNGKDVCVLVPEQYSNDFDKKLYLYIGAENFNKLLSLSFNSLARHIFQIYGDTNRNGEYADEFARMILIYQAISSAKANPDSLTFFDKKSNQNGFAEEVMKIITDMKHSGITPLDLRDKSALFTDKLSDKTADIASIYYEYERIMHDYGFKDNFEDIYQSAVVTNLNRYFKGKCVCLDEFESFNADQIAMIKVIFSMADDVVITLRTDNLTSGKYTLFETVNTTYNQLSQICREMNYKIKVTSLTESHRFRSSDLKYLSERIMRNLPYEPQNAPELKSISLFEAKDMYSEVEYVCARIKKLVHLNNTVKYRDIAVISNNIENYADVLKAGFERYDIPYFLSIERSISHTPIIMFFTTLIDLLTARKIHSEQIFRLLKCGILEENFTEISLLENYCYKWEVDGDVWYSEFTAKDGNLDIIESLRKRTIEPIIELKQKLKGKLPAEKICQLIYDYLVECNAERSTGRLMNQLIKDNRDHEAGELKRLWGCLINILDSIAGTIGRKEVSMTETANIMRSMIGTITYSVIPPTLDEVTAASARTARLNSPKIIFVIGATEGDFPNQVSLHGLFSDGDKQRLSKCGIDISRPVTELVASERLIVYKALSTASHRLYITYPLSDLAGEQKYPAPVISQIKKMFIEDDNRRIVATEDDFTPDFYAVTKKSAYYHYIQDRAKSNISSDKRAKYAVSVASIEKVLNSDEEYSARIKSVNEYNRKINPDEFGEIEEQKNKISTETLTKLRDFSPLLLSPSDVESYSKCHFMFFCEKCLRLQIPEKIDLDSRITGELAHECFHRIFSTKNKNEIINISESEIISEIDKFALYYLNKNLGGNFSKTPRFEFFFNKVKEQLVNVFIHAKQELQVTKFEPRRFEFNVDGKSKDFVFGDNKILNLHGKIDRLDIWENETEKYLRIIDYKSSEKKIDVFNLANGINLQMLLYLFMTTEKGADFGEYTPAGVLYYPVGISSSKLEVADSKNTGKQKTDTDSNETALNSLLKSTGLLIDDVNVLDAMESGVNGDFIPAKITKNNTIDKRRSSVLPKENMKLLKEFVYDSVVEMAESLYSGNIEANPFNMAEKSDTKPKLACEYCNFKDMCNNSEGAVFRKSNTEKQQKAEEIIGKKKKDDGNED